METESVRPPSEKPAKDARMWRTQANAFPTLSFEEIRNPRRWHLTLKERRNTEIENYSDPNRRNIIATTAFSAFQLNDLIARVAGEYTANELIKGLTDAGAAEAALRVAETMQNYGHGERPLREYAQEIKANKGYMRDKDDYDARGRYVQTKDKTAPRGLEFAKVLVGKASERREPRSHPCRMPTVQVSPVQGARVTGGRAPGHRGERS